MSEGFPAVGSHWRVRSPDPFRGQREGEVLTIEKVNSYGVGVTFGDGARGVMSHGDLRVRCEPYDGETF